VTGNFVLFVGAQYLAICVMYVFERKYGIALTFFAYALGNVGLFIAAR